MQHGSSTRTSLPSILIFILEDKDDLEQGGTVTAFTFFSHLSLLSVYYCKSNKVIPSHGLHPGYRSLV